MTVHYHRFFTEPYVFSGFFPETFIVCDSHIFYIKIYLVRHGESEANTKSIYQGQLDTSLSTLGKEQARLVGDRFSNITDFDVLYTSDLKRAFETAQEIYRNHKHISLIKDIRLRERSHGDFEGQSHALHLYEKLTEKDGWFKKAPCGENYFDHKKRVALFLDEILKKNQNCVIVSHGGTMRILLEILLSAPKEDFYFNRDYPINNTAIFIIEIESNTVTMHVENCSKHLENNKE
ncbi:MAG: histidine phosphatase family protein [Candidatus Woesearchaeota archaeon]